MNNSEIEETIRNAASETVDLNVRLEQIFKEHYGLLPTSENQPDVGYMAYGLLAVDVSIRIANLFLSIKKDRGVHRVACDFIYQLNTNDFWQKNASVIIPTIHVALNTHTDGVLLQIERATRGDYSSTDALISASRAAPLEIFPVIAYLLGGPVLMLAASLPLKRDLAPYFLS